MYLETIGLLSICFSGVGVYVCIQNEVVKREDIETCFRKVDETLTDMEQGFLNLTEKAKREVLKFVDKLKNQIDTEDTEDNEVEEEENRLLKSNHSVELLAEMSVNSPQSPNSEGEKTLEEFILLSEGEKTDEE